MYDLKIVNGLIISGVEGEAPLAGSVAVRDGRIAAVDGRLSGDARRVLDAGGAVVCPGFIDLHTHCRVAQNLNFLQAGVTLVVGGNCGFSPAPVAETAARSSGACGPNLACLTGHNTARLKAMGNADRKPAAAELDQMRQRIAADMAAGAMGFSAGLTYVPGHYAATDEVVALAKVAADCGGYYAVHMRNEGERIRESVDETLSIGTDAGLPVHVSHIKLSGCNVWGQSQAVLSLLDAARRRGLDATQDQYPYTASCGRILLLLSPWLQEGTPDELRTRLTDATTRARAQAELVRKLDVAYGGDASRVTIATAPEARLEGCTLADVAGLAGLSASTPDVAKAVLDLVVQHPEQQAIYCVFHAMSEDDVRVFLRHPFTSVASDGWGIAFGAGHPHPRQYGTCPRVLGHYARDEKLFPLPEAVRRMTSLPASRLGLTDRGLLAEGAWADIVVFDPAAIRDRATFDKPHQYPDGIAWVLVNGQVAVDHGQPSGLMPGTFVPRPSSLADA